MHIQIEYGFIHDLTIIYGLGVVGLGVVGVVNTITQQILVALDPNFYHGCIAGVSWLSSKMDDLYLCFEVMGVDFNMKNSNFRL